MADQHWNPERIRRLRGNRTQEEFGKLIRLPKNTIWRWEADYARPDARRSKLLAAIAKKEGFIPDWTIADSAVLLGDLEQGSKLLSRQFKLPGKKPARG